MASQSDGTPGKRKARFSRMKQPPLIKQLRGILDEYPDGGQIIKELIQNAEDAGARTVKILYDARRFNRDIDDKTQVFTKFFQGPALCVFNDAEFSDEDWEGIRMIYSSVKEDDKLKVGRFGLGFKSVFHITDYPCIISGDQVLLVDPQQPAEEVNAMMYINEIAETEGMDTDAFLKAFDECFGFSKDTITKGTFNGTLLWFPLREHESEISDTLYKESKVKDLFGGFQSEAPGILTFLKNLEVIELYTKQNDTEMERIVKVHIDDCDGLVRQAREEFKQRLVANTNSDSFEEDVKCSFKMTVNTVTKQGNVQNNWFVVNYVVGKSASPEFKKLMKDKNVGYSPCVGIAVCLDYSVKVEGHIFCFLPLPKEGSRLTGLPFHVNGFFALSQNRHHLKWATEEQKGMEINDKSILWNERMITEALPKAYEVLVNCVIQISNAANNNKENVYSVYTLLPDKNKVVDEKWSRFVDEALRMVECQKIVFCRKINEWIALPQATFATFTNLPADSDFVKPSVLQCLSVIEKRYVDIPKEQFVTLNTRFGNLTDISPKLLSEFMRGNQQYKSLSDDMKLDVLAYLLSNQDTNIIEGLELLPLASGQWTTFTSSGQNVLVCADSEIQLFPGLENNFLQGGPQFGQQVRNTLTTVLQRGLYQLRNLTEDHKLSLLQQVLDAKLNHRIMEPGSPIQLDWLQKVWQMILSKPGSAIKFQNLPLLPILERGTWASYYRVKLIPLSTKLVLLQQNIVAGVCSCLQLLGVTLLPDLPCWIPMDSLRQFTGIYTSSHDSIVTLLTDLATAPSLQQRINAFNSGFQDSWKGHFVNFLKEHLNPRSRDLLSKLRLFGYFEYTKCVATPCSFLECEYYIEDHEEDSFPQDVKFPSRCLKISSTEIALVQYLGGKKLQVVVFMEQTLNRIKFATGDNETIKAMRFFITNFERFRNPANLIKVAKEIYFLRAGNSWFRPMDLFDPSDRLLKELFSGENKFPDLQRMQDSKMLVLRKLGLKSINDVTSNDLLSVAKTLDKWCRSGKETTSTLQKKADTFLEFIGTKPKYLTEYCADGHELGRALQSLSCINCNQNQPTSVRYPPCLSLYSHTLSLCKPTEVKVFKHWQLVGSTMPLVQTPYSKVSEYFKWNQIPPTDKIVEQLKQIRYSNFALGYIPDILPLLNIIYETMSSRPNEFLGYKRIMIDEELLWTDGEFLTPSKIVMNHDKVHDIDLRPYFQYMPKEFQRWKYVYQMMGCRENQDLNVLLDALLTIKDKYSNSHAHEDIVRKDRRVVGEIFNRLAEIRKESTSEFPEERLIMMIHHDDEETIHFAPITECVYDDDKDFLDEEDEESGHKYVHTVVKLETAKILGVKSLTRKALLDAEDVGLEEWGQKENLTTRIHTLLRDGYTDGFSVPKELIQNADDANATTVKFLYDERKNVDARKRLFSSKLEECQGPALWVYNDSKFTQDDLNNITKLNGATKKNDTQTIGKFGLGFCSVYNLTELPSFISGDHMVMFDPHETYLEDARQTRGTGLKVKLTKRTLIRRHIDQFKPFEGLFGCSVVNDGFEAFNGTLFRLPLRTAVQADKSKISSKAYTQNEMKELLRMFLKGAGNLLLFSQNIHTIELHHLAPDADTPLDMEIWFKVKKTCFSMKREILMPDQSQILKRASCQMQVSSDFADSQIVTIKQDVHKSGCNFLGVDHDHSENSSWLISWAMCKDVNSITNEHGAIPLAATAVPLSHEAGSPVPVERFQCGGFYDKGHLYCFMPLPIPSGLPVHINGCFSVTSDRRGLMALTEDDKKSNVSKWNDVLLERSVVTAFLQQLVILSNQHTDSDVYKYDMLWPRQSAMCTQPFVSGFYKALIDDNVRVFKSVKGYVSFSEVMFLEPNVLNESSVGPAAFEMLTALPIEGGKQIMVMQGDVLRLLKQHNPNRADTTIKQALITENAMLIHFLNNIHDPFWTDNVEKRNILLKHALLRSDEEVDKVLKETNCIPTEPHGNLAMICELIDPHSGIAKMFTASDERFPSSELFRETYLLQRLACLGMNDTRISNSLLIDRCESVHIVLQQCISCGHGRLIQVIKYISEYSVLFELRNMEVLNTIKECLLLPVLPRPDKWCFAWQSDLPDAPVLRIQNSQCTRHASTKQDNIMTAKPVQLFRMKQMNCVGTHSLVLNEKTLTESGLYLESVLPVLGVLDEKSLTVKILMGQLDNVSDKYSISQHNTNMVESICKHIYENLHAIMMSTPHETFRKEMNEDTLEKHIILVGNNLVKPKNVFVEIKKECPPDLYHLPSSQYLNLFLMFGMKRWVETTDIIECLKSQKEKWQGNICDNIELIGHLLENLVWCMKREEKNYLDMRSDSEYIVAPDSDGYLFPSHELALEDVIFKSSSNVRLLNGNCITPDNARFIGVKSKKAMVVRGFSKLIPFGQREKLTTRLNGLLKDYPCDSSIMKELIQNADDAGATEIHFIKCLETTKMNKSFGESNVLEPALCIYNNSCFTEDDFTGIQNLGIGSKTDDPFKTGQYGVGFNAVYHLTDVPSFLTKGPGLGTKGQLCIFDPLFVSIKEHITDESPGIRCDVEYFEENFADYLKGYPDYQAEKGTTFRLPLRKHRSKISEHCISIDDLNIILQDFVNHMGECLHFVKNIQTIKVLSYAQGKLTEEYSVNAQLSAADKEKRTQFFDRVKAVTLENADEKERNLEIEPFSISYTMKIKERIGRIEEWYIVNRFGGKICTEQKTQLESAFKCKDIGLIPLGGVSIKLCGGHVEHFLRKLINKDNNPQTNIVTANTGFKAAKGVAFCFLPLPIETGLPFHINAHFAVDRGRRGLRNDGIPKMWNNYILDGLVVGAIYTSLVYLQKYWFESSQNLLINRQIQSFCLSSYHNCFPQHRLADGTEWKFLTHSFYTKSFSEKFQIFPVIRRDNFEEGVSIDVTWTYMSQTEDSFDHGVFNTISNFTIPYGFNSGNVRQVEEVLKCIGLRIIDSPKSIRDSIKDANIKPPPICCDPEIVISFLKVAIKNDYFSQYFGDIGSPLHDTAFADIDHLTSVIHYIKKDDTYYEKMDGLPLNLTNDGNLRVFEKGNAIYCSKFCDCFSSSSELFVHQSLVSSFQVQKLQDEGFIKQLQMEDMLQLLPRTFDMEQYRRGTNILWEKKTASPVDPKVVCDLFNFIYEQSCTRLKEGCSLQFSQELFENNLKQLQNWAFLPTRYKYGETGTFELIPVCNLHHILQQRYGLETEVYDVLRKFNIPELDRDVFQNVSNVPNALQKLVASTENPMQLLKCLHKFKEKIVVSMVSCTDAASVLGYFSNRCVKLEEQFGSNVRHLIRSLPLFETFHGSLVNIDANQSMFILPSMIPTDGISAFSDSTGIVFLKYVPSLCSLHKYLNLSGMSPLDMYACKILPNILHLPSETWMKHIEFIKDNVLLVRIGKSLDKEQQRIVNMLKELPFIELKGERRKVQSFYNAEDPVFQQMLGDDKFLPELLRTEDWKDFLEKVGLITEPTGQMVIEFAKQIACESMNEEEEVTRKKSEVVCDFIFESEADKHFMLQEIKHIKFVFPYVVDAQEESIVRSHGKKSILICFNDAIPKEHAALCWSSANLLSEVPGDNKMLPKLGIWEKPPVEKVVKHCHNLCETFSNMLKDGNVTCNMELYMEKIYTYLRENFNPSIVEKLKHRPFVLIPGEILMHATHVYLESNDDFEIKPYLYRAPKVFRNFFELFEKVGSQEKVTGIHYISVLSTIKSEFGDNPIPYATLQCVRKAIEGLFNSPKTTSSYRGSSRLLEIPDGVSLYLPNTNAVLVKSSLLTVSDNSVYRTLLQGKHSIEYFIGMQAIEIDMRDPVGRFKSLPENIRPRILSEDVSENVCEDNVVELESGEANRWQLFLTSPELLEGIIRLVRHNYNLTSASQTFDEGYEDMLIKTLLNAKITQVDGLTTILLYKRHIVEGTTMDRHCFIKPFTIEPDNNESPIETYQMYFQIQPDTAPDDVISLMQEGEDGLMHLLTTCTDRKLNGRSLLILSSLLKFVNNPEGIKTKLDRLSIIAYNLPHLYRRSRFPKPGTYVEEMFYPFLVQLIKPFNVYEFMYVALELENEDNDTDDENEPVYIYANIKKELPRKQGDTQLSIKYLVDIGNRYEGQVKVPIYRLFRFLPQADDVGQELKLYDDEALGTLPFDENCRRVRDMLKEAWGLGEKDRRRIVRRLLLRWHPDKNIGQEDYAKRVFNYLKEIIVRLERNENVDDPVNDATGRGSPDMSDSRYSNMSNRADQTARAHAQAYHDNFDEYNRSQRKGKYAHQHSQTVLRPSLGEARRWLKQAKLDFSTAQIAWQGVMCNHGFNWICYNCHQACEKALKAAWFSRDANKCPLKSHSLTSIAYGLDERSFIDEVDEFEGHLGIRGSQYFRLRYPDSVAGTQIPADVFSREDAQFAVESTKRLLDSVDDFIQ